MEQLKKQLEKINKLTNSSENFSNIEKDMLLSYIRAAYEIALEIEVVKASEIFESEIGIAPLVEDKLDAMKEPIPDEPISKNVVFMEQIFEEKGEKFEPHFEPEPSLKTNLDFSTNYEINEGHIVDEIAAEEEKKVIQNVIPTAPISKLAEGFGNRQKDIKKYIGINDRYNFIAELFGGNAEAFDEILTEINNCDSKESATAFLENSGITTLYSWEKEGASEDIFYNILSQFFAAK